MSDMTDKEWCAYAFARGWATVESLKIWVIRSKITEADYQEITKIAYVP